MDGVRLNAPLADPVLPFTALLDDRGFNVIEDPPSTFIGARRRRKRSLNTGRGLIPMQV